MPDPTLKRLLKREGIAVLESVLTAIALPLVIWDQQGNRLFGAGGVSGSGVEAEGLRTIAGAPNSPIQAGQAVVGWVSWTGADSDEAWRKVAAIAQLISHWVTGKLEEKYLANEALETYRELNLLYSIAEKLSMCLELKDVAKLVLDEAVRLIPATNASLMLMEEGTDNLHIIGARGPEYSPKMPLRPGVGLAGKVALTGRAIVINDVYSEPGDFIPGPNPIASLICVPLKTRERVIGVINLSSHNPVEYTARDLKLLNALAAQAAPAIYQLRHNEEKYRKIFENAMDGIYQSSMGGQYLSANPALARIYGYASVEQLLTELTEVGQQLYVQPKRRAEFLAYMRAYDEVEDFESEVYRRDGSVVWISENVQSVRDRDGNFLYFQGTVKDITAQRRLEEELRRQRQQAEYLLLNILPQPIAERLKTQEQKGTDQTIADNFAESTVLFADLVGFTTIAAETSPIDLVNLLNQIFSTFDRLADRYKLEKIKTIGDAYMVVGGLPVPRPDHTDAIANLALEMQSAIAQFATPAGMPFQMRIGIHTGPVTAGVIGIKKFIYDLWGDTVNLASRMESQGLPGRIQVTETTYEKLRDRYYLEKRGEIDVKGRGHITTYWLTGKRSSEAKPHQTSLDRLSPTNQLPQSLSDQAVRSTEPIHHQADEQDDAIDGQLDNNRAIKAKIDPSSELGINLNPINSTEDNLQPIDRTPT